MTNSSAAPRRSSRIKRKAEKAEAAAVAAAQQPLQPPPAKKRKGSTKPPSKVLVAVKDQPQKSSLYKQSTDTLFLASNLQSILWTPPNRRAKGAPDAEAELAKFNYDVHAYFRSRRAATVAAARSAPVAMYRHIGCVVLRKLKPDEETIQPLKKGKDDLVNILEILRVCKGADMKLLRALYSLAEKGQEPYFAPYIVGVAKRHDLLKCDCKRGTDIVLQIYAGRLLFELIANLDTKTLFEALQPVAQFKKLPKMKEYPATLGKSPSPAKDDTYTLSGLLRRAESVGYASLSEEQRQRVNDHLTVRLYPFQEQTVKWMIDKENDKYSINEYFWEERFFTNSGNDGKKLAFYYFPKAGELRLSKPPATRGGMVTEEMGLGKTVEALALIAAQKEPTQKKLVSVYCESKPTGATFANGKVSVGKLKQRNEDSVTKQFCPFHYGDEVIRYNENEPYPKTVKVRRWTPQTTLVVCPKSLIAQWGNEALTRAPALSVVEWKVPTQKEPGTSCDVAVGPNAQDIVLATYEDLQKDISLSKICWKRLILDEAQVTRRSSTQVARDTFNLRSESRFLMTGTPIVTDIDDLRGELAFLKVWPFTLFQDGFWESQIQYPFSARVRTGLIDHLLNVTMMRHTKAQQLSLSLPPRTYETIEVELSGSHRAVYCFILALCLEELDLWSRSSASPRQLRALLRLLMSVCISPELLNLNSLDLLRRHIWARRGVYRRRHEASRLDLAKVTPIEAIQFLAETSDRIVRDSNRSRVAPLLASLSMEEQGKLLEFHERRMTELGSSSRSGRQQVLIPDSVAQIAASVIYHQNAEAEVKLQEQVVALGLHKSICESTTIKTAAAIILGLHALAQSGDSSIHESGFSALTRLIEKNESPGCPVCLSPTMDRISLTKCGHFYCVDCLLLMCTSAGADAKCAMCRREIAPGSAVEVIKPSKADKEVDVAPLLGLKEEDEEDATKTMRFIAQSDSNRYRRAKRPTTEEAWKEYKDIGPAHYRFNRIGLDPTTPSLEAEFMRHHAAASCRRSVPPKYFALRSLIDSSSPDSKFCVVAETVESLRGICEWLDGQGIASVGVGSPEWSASSDAIGRTAMEFATDANIRVFLLNTANAAGLTLTAAQYIVFMEPMLRITDEMQAAARVHRIGQTKPVKVIRIVTRNTVEEQVMFRRGDIRTARQESDALLSANGRETPTRDLIRLFRDLRDWEEDL